MRSTHGRWWWADGHIAAHMYDVDDSPDGLTYREECGRCVSLARPWEARP